MSTPIKIMVKKHQLGDHVGVIAEVDNNARQITLLGAGVVVSLSPLIVKQDIVERKLNRKTGTVSETSKTEHLHEFGAAIKISDYQDLVDQLAAQNWTITRVDPKAWRAILRAQKRAQKRAATA